MNTVLHVFVNTTIGFSENLFFVIIIIIIIIAVVVVVVIIIIPHFIQSFGSITL